MTSTSHGFISCIEAQKATPRQVQTHGFSYSRCPDLDTPTEKACTALEQVEARLTPLFCSLLHAQ
jgi:hypothetical protein